MTNRISTDAPPAVPMSDECLAAELTGQLDQLLWLLLASPEHRKPAMANICLDAQRLVGELTDE